MPACGRDRVRGTGDRDAAGMGGILGIGWLLVAARSRSNFDSMFMSCSLWDGPPDRLCSAQASASEQLCCHQHSAWCPPTFQQANTKTWKLIKTTVWLIVTSTSC